MTGHLALQACVAEVLSPKAGNVHPQADFDDVTWLDFVTSAIVTAPILDRAGELGVGETVLQCVIATQNAVACNTNLGIVLLLAPLCVVEDPRQVGDVLASLDREDAEQVYEAIRLVQPGGMGRVDRADIRDTQEEINLIAAMRFAADRDAVARQYTNDFADIFDHVVPDLVGIDRPLDEVIVTAHLRQMAREGDSLIRRKCGEQVACEAQQRAQAVLDGDRSFDELDRWLRDDGNRRNPGTSADLITAGLFVALSAGQLTFPTEWANRLPLC